MSTLYSGNTLPRFWRLEAEVPLEEWRAATDATVGVLPNGAEVLAQGGWDGLMDYVLGEGQFGPNRHHLSHFKRLYYRVRPMLPRALTAIARRRYRGKQQTSFRLAWPIEDRYVRFVYRALETVVQKNPTIPPSRFATPGPRSATRRLGFWPNDARFAFVLTHDVERATGQALVRTLADLDERYGFRSSFNFVPEAYLVDEALQAELRGRGFEVGVHGLKHDGKLFLSRTEFERRAQRINHYLRKWGAVGFRSPFTHRNPEWMQALEVEYDSSFFDTDPYEPVAGGTMSIWPFFCGRFVELPYTLVQDHTLLVTLGQRSPKVWLDKVDFIARWGGMALVNVHPDYMGNPAHLAVYEAFLRRMAKPTDRPDGRGGMESAESAPPYWHALPRDVARWWRARAEGSSSSTRNSSLEQLTSREPQR